MESERSGGGRRWPFPRTRLASATAAAAAIGNPARSFGACVSVLFLSTLFCPLWMRNSVWDRIVASESIACPSKGKPTCSAPPPPIASHHNSNTTGSPICPGYFGWIHEDLRTWRATGITKETLDGTQGGVHFRLVIVNGRVYVDRYKRSIQTRDVFTIWGILQLLRRYPGRIPDLDLMFNCNDHPFVPRTANHSAAAPPPVFSYCGDDDHLDLIFPDWSFWGWPEINIKPWNHLLEEMMRGNEKLKWEDREPYAYWKGNPHVYPKRGELLGCNVSSTRDWNARLFSMDWRQESRRGYKDSNLADQCKYRYKIYVEGYGWSVSEKYILACDSPALFVTRRYHDFFTRGLVPTQHYWPIRVDDMCSSVKFAVDWGNAHPRQAQTVGRRGSGFVREELKMDLVYDYMFHLLNEYSKLLKFRPSVPPKAVEFCLESMARGGKGLTKIFMVGSMVKSPPSTGHPCRLPSPFTAGEKKASRERKANLTKHVEFLQQKFYKEHA